MIRRFLIEHSRIIGLIALCSVLAVVEPGFLDHRNLLNVLRQSALVVVLATGLTFTLITAGIDLSVASVLAMSGTIMGALMAGSVPWGLAVLAGLAAASLAGLLNGLMITYVRIPPFVATYGMLWIAQGIAIFIASAQIFFGFPRTFVFLGQGWLLGIPTPVILVTLLVLATWGLERRTRLGRGLFAMGANPAAAHRYGISRNRNLLFVYTFSGFTAGLAAVLYVARLNAASAELSLALLLPVLAAVVIGGTSLFGGEGGIVQTVLGALIMTVIINGMNLLNVHSFLQLSVVGALVIAAVLFDRWVAVEGPSTIDEPRPPSAEGRAEHGVSTAGAT